MKSLENMWEELKSYLSCERGLDEGYADGKYTRYFAKYCKHIVGIDISEDFYNQAKENLKDLDNVDLKIMDALHVEYPDKYFDVILCTSFHEFDMSGKEEFKMDLDLKRNILKEMSRLSDTIVFAEPSTDNLSSTLYKVFNPIEEHALRTHVAETTKTISDANTAIDLLLFLKLIIFLILIFTSFLPAAPLLKDVGSTTYERSLVFEAILTSERL